MHISTIIVVKVIITLKFCLDEKDFNLTIKPKIEEARELYNLNEKAYSDDRITQALLFSNFDLGDAFINQLFSIKK